MGIDWFVAYGSSINPRKRQVWFESSVYTDSKTSELDFSEDEMEVMLTDKLDEIEDIESDMDGWDFRPNEKLKFENFELLSYEEIKKHLNYWNQIRSYLREVLMTKKSQVIYRLLI